MTNIKAIVIGLGSMGKRRIRCLQMLGVKEIIGFDLREDRQQEAKQSYGVKIVQTLSDVWSENADVAIISVPPLSHVEIMKLCIENNVHFFVEASVVNSGLVDVVTLLEKTNLVGVPSATLRFHPAIIAIRNLLSAGSIGSISNVTLHSGQYLPNWHSYEDVSDFYVSHKETGGAREIVPFEFTWLTEIIGFPKRLAATFGKTIEIPGASDIDDTYNILCDFENFYASVTVDVVSKYATRQLSIIGSDGQIYWTWDRPEIKIFDVNKEAWTSVPITIGTAAAGYNKNISEQMYIDEINAFLKSVNGKETFPNCFRNDLKVLNILYAAEKSHTDGNFVSLI